MFMDWKIILLGCQHYRIFFLVDIKIYTLKFRWNLIGSQIAKITLKRRNKIGGLTFHDF